jgi:TRAP-type mannitol/chloroaromatic compound transport system permease small subunit
MGIYVPGTTEIAGYGMAAAGALGLAHTAINSGHVRVDLILSRLGTKPRNRMEVLAVAASTIVIVVTAWAVCRMVATSLRFGDLSSNSDGLPLWMPQLPVAVGFVVFAISLAHLTVLALLGRIQASHAGGPQE